MSEIDTLLDGGLPIGAITEMVGPESSGRIAIAIPANVGDHRNSSL